MNFITAVKTCVVEKYCCFKGRARRSEFWYFYLASALLSLVISTFGMGDVMGAFQRFMTDQDPIAYMTAIFTAPAMIVSMVVAMALLLPTLGVTVRRLHDTGKSGWWVLGYYVLCCIPVLNFLSFPALIYMIYLWCKDSEPGENEYGPNPKGDNFDSSDF